MSIPSAFKQENQQGGIVTEFGYETKAENMHVLYYIARNQLYSDEIMALLREYGVNGMDIHIQIGQPELPIQITLPTQLDSFLKIRDFGTGLDENGIKEYVSFGESSKRGDPNQTGQLGIGCKCGFTYGDSFIVNSYQNGVMTSWNAYIDPSNKGKIAKMGDSVTTESNGIEVVIPIKANDVNKVHEKAMFLFSFAKVIPTFVNATEQDLATLKNYIETRATPVFGGEGWQYLGKGTSYAIMGNIPYPIKADVFTDTEITAETKELLDGGIILNFKMDELDFAASREQLKYTPKTKKNVSARLTDVTNDLMKQCSTSFDGCKTLWEAKLLYKKVFDFYGKLYKLRNLFRGSLKFNGFNINTESFSTRLSTGNDTDVTCMVYRAGKETLTKEHVYNIPADANIMVVENDGILNGVKNRLVEPLMRSVNKVDSIYLLSFTSDAVRTQWFTEVGLDCPITKLSTMTKHPMSSFYLSSSNYYGSRSTKHASKEFTFDGDGKTRYGNKRSDFWEEVEVDAAKDTGVYVALDAFHVDMPNTYNQFAFAHPSELSKLLKSFADAGIEVPDTIYGFKTSAVDKAMKNPNMQTLWVWLEKAVKDVITNDTVLAQKFINRNYVANTVYSLQTSLATMLSYIAKWGLPDTHPLMVLHVKMSELQNYRSAQMDKLNELLQKFNCVPKGAPTHDVKDEYEALAAKYPLLFQHVKDCSSASHLCYDHHQKLFKDYIDLVDLVTP